MEGSPHDRDRALIDRIAEGHEEALAQLANRFAATLWRLLYHELNGQRPLMEEILQEVFMGVWQGAHKFRGDCRVEVWISKIAYNQAVAARKKSTWRLAQRSSTLPDDDTPGAVFTALTIPSPEDAVAANLELTAALNALPPEQRIVFHLFLVQGFSYREIAQTLDIPLGTVKSRLSAARDRLRQVLAKPGASVGVSPLER